jgi:hypothetical protein
MSESQLTYTALDVLEILDSATNYISSSILARDGFQTFRDFNEVQDGSSELIFALNVLEHMRTIWRPRNVSPQSLRGAAAY